MELPGKKRNIEKRRWQWLLSIELTTLLFLLTFATTPIIFSTNDDVRILYTLAGYNTGSPYSLQPFINSFLGKAISLLYEWFPRLPWYGIFHIACLFIGVTVVGKCLLKNAAKKQLHLLVPLFLQTFLFYACYIFIIVGIQFSTTPALLGSAAVALMLCIDRENDSKADICIDIALSLVFLLVCMMTRSFTWYCIMCFYALATFYQFLRTFPSEKKKSGKWRSLLAGCLIIALISGFGIRQLSLYLKDKIEHNPGFEEYNEYRVDFQDYKMRPAFDDNPELYAQIGWSRNTYSSLAGALLYFDRNMNAEDLKVITETYASSVTSVRTWQDTWTTATAVLKNYDAAICALATLFVLSLMCLFAAIGNKKCWKAALCALFAFLGYLIMYLYLSYRGRFLIRIFTTITVPACTYMALALTQLLDRQKLKKFSGIFLSVIFSLVILALCVFNIRTIYFTDEYTKTQTKTTATLEQFQQFEEYAIENIENVYVYDFTAATVHRDPFVVYPEGKPYNCIISGGSYTFSTVYDLQLAANGLGSLYWEDFLRDNVYYVSADMNFVNKMIAGITEATQRSIGYSEVASFADDGIKIYKFYIAG